MIKLIIEIIFAVILGVIVFHLFYFYGVKFLIKRFGKSYKAGTKYEEEITKIVKPVSSKRKKK